MLHNRHADADRFPRHSRTERGKAAYGGATVTMTGGGRRMWAKFGRNRKRSFPYRHADAGRHTGLFCGLHGEGRGWPAFAGHDDSAAYGLESDYFDANGVVAVQTNGMGLSGRAQTEQYRIPRRRPTITAPGHRLRFTLARHCLAGHR